MHPCQFFLALTFLVSAILRVAAQGSLEFHPPATITECVPAHFSWDGGVAPFNFYVASDVSNPPVDDLYDTTSNRYLTYTSPIFTGGSQYRFKVVDDSGQSKEQWITITIASSGACSSPTFGSSSMTSTGVPSSTPTTILYTTGMTTGMTTAFTTTLAGGGGSTTGTQASTTVLGTTTTKQTTYPGSPSPTPGNTVPGNPSNPSESHPLSPGDPTSNPDTQLPGSGGSSGSPSGPSGIGGASDGSLTPGETRTPNQTGGQSPTQTAAPLRNTQDDQANNNVSMSSQAKGAIIGTITGAFLVFIGFLCFRWRRRHQQKHRPIQILPGVGSNGDDLTTAVIPTVYHDPPLMQSTGHPLGGSPEVSYPYPASPSTSRPVPVTAPLRLLPSSKHAMAARPRPPSSDYGSEGTASLGAPETWRSSHDQTSGDGSISHYPEDQMHPPPPGSAYLARHGPVIPGYSGYQGQNSQPTATSSAPSPLSLQQLIGRELDNILSSPDTYSPDSPLYTPTSASIRDPLIRGLRVVNNGTEPSSGSSGVVSSPKHPQGVRGDADSLHRDGGPRTATPEIMGSASTSVEDSRGGGGAIGGGSRQRVAISRNDMQYLADLVAARITRDTGQRTQPGRADVDPPSYV